MNRFITILKKYGMKTTERTPYFSQSFKLVENKNSLLEESNKIDNSSIYIFFNSSS